MNGAGSLSARAGAIMSAAANATAPSPALETSSAFHFIVAPLLGPHFSQMICIAAKAEQAY